MKKNKFILSLMIIFTLIIIFVNADVVFPGWSNNVTYPNSSNPYTGFNQFNTTWNDAENLSVWIEHNFTGVLINSSELPNSSKVYYYNTGNITPGSYVWRMFANDTSGNLNVSNFSIYVVNRANSSLNLSINDSTDNLTIGIETYFLINSTVMDGDNQNITLFIDGSIINISTSIMNNYIFYSEGLKNITLVYNVSENYTASSVTYFVNITDTTLNSTLNFSDDSFFGQSSITFNITTNKWAICEFKPINITYDFAGLNHGFIHGANWTDNGSIGGAFNFDGVDDYISLKSDFSSSVAETFTLMFWFKTNNTDEQQSLVDFGRDTYGSGWRTFVSSDLLYFTLNNNTDDDLHELILTTPFTETNIWKHVTIIYNTSGSYLYINGVYNTSDDYVNSAVWRYNEYLTIGSLAFSQGNYFLLNGSIDEIKIYNRALSANEISNDYNGSRSNNGLVLYLPFNQDQTTKDYSDSNLTGYVHGATWTTDGINSSAYEFDGIYDYIEETNLNLSGNLSRTISVWYKTSESEQTQSIWASLISMGDDSAPGLKSLMITVNSNECDNSNSIAGHYWGYNTCSDKNLTELGLNEWHNIVLTTNETHQKIYIDGIFEGNSSHDLDLGSGPTYIGMRSNGFISFNGTIDDVRIYNRSLNDSEILDLYNGTASETDLVLYLPFNKTSMYSSMLSDNSTHNITYSFDEQSYSLDFMCVDRYNNTINSYVYDITIDTINPILTLNYPNETFTTNNNTIELNYTINETNIGKVWYQKNYLQTKYYINKSSGNNLQNVSFSLPGKEIISIYLNDSNEKISTTNFTFYVNQTLNATNWSRAFNLSNKNITSFNLMNTSGIFRTSNISMDENISIQINTTNFSIEIYNISALLAMWDFNFYITDNSSDFESNVDTEVGTNPIDYLYIQNFTLFYNETTDYFAKVILPNNSTYYDNIYFCANDDLSDCTNITSCSTNYNDSLTTACYSDNDTYAEVYTPSVGSVFGANDSVGPTITFISPVAESTINLSYEQDLIFTTNENANCSFSFNSGNDIKLGYGTSFAVEFNATVNTYQNFFINCSDANNNFGDNTVYFTINDITNPVISNFDIDRSSSVLEFTFDTNEPANLSITLSSGTTKINRSFILSHYINFSSLSGGTDYYYNYTVCDQLRNCVNGTGDEDTTGSSSSTTSTTETSTTTGSAAGGSTTVQKVFTELSIGQHSMDIISSAIALTRIVFNTNKIFNTSVFMTVSKTNLPAEIIHAPNIIYQYIRIDKTVITENDIDSATIKFRVENEWITTNNISRDSIVLYRYSDNKWNKLSTSKLSTDDVYTYFESSSPGLSYLAVSGELSEIISAGNENQNGTIVVETNNDITGNTAENIDDLFDNNDNNSNGSITKSGSSVTFMIVFFFILTAIIIAGILGFYFYQKSISPGDDNKLKEIREYVHKCRLRGIDDSSIYDTLVKAGWDKTLVNVVISNSQHIENPEVNKVVEYISEARKVNATDYEIRNELEKVGWDKDLIIEGFAKAH